MEWKRIEPTKVTKVGWRKIVSKTFRMNNGAEAVFDTVGPEDFKAVAVVALTPDNTVVTVHQFRTGPEMMMYELPGGLVDAGEDLEVAARRELKEETGYESDSFTYLGRFYKDSLLNGEWHVFLARNCTQKCTQMLDEFEEIETKIISIDNLLANAKKGEMTDIPGVFMAYDELTKIQEGA